MNLPSFAIKRPVTTFMIFLLVLVMGVVSITRINVELLPEMTFPVATVMTTYEGVGPQEIENLVTRPLEGVLATVANIEKITTYSAAGQSVAVLEFGWGTDMDFALLEVREKIDLIKGYLPDGVEDPLVFKFDLSSMLPVISLALSGQTDLVTLKKLADEEIKPALERLAGVASVDVSGGLVPLIKVEVDPIKLHAYGLTLQNITQLLQAENLNLPGGTVQAGNMELIVRTTGEFQRLEQIENLNIPSARGALVKLKDVATISFAYDEVKGYVMFNGQPAVGIAIQKETDANTVNVARRVQRELIRIKQDLPAGVDLNIVMNQADFIQFAIDTLQRNAVIGGLLAITILFVFLRNVASTLIIGVAIPTSIIATFVVMYLSKLELNMMTLGGLALGIGMLVDNAIVVLENIFRFRDQGYDLREAAVEGSTEVGMAIAASTLTTIVVFLPVVFMSGMTAQFFKEFSLTVTFSLVVSLLVAQTLVPLLSSRFLLIKKKPPAEVAAGQASQKERLGWYKKCLAWALAHRKTVILAVAFMTVISLVMAFRLGAEFIPNMDQGMIMVQIAMPKGTVLRETERVVQQVEGVVFALPEVEMVATTLGGGGISLSGSGMNFSSASSDQAALTIQLIDKKQRSRSADQVAEAIRKQIDQIPGAEIQVQSAFMSFSGGKPVSINLKGPDFTRLGAIAEDLVKIIQTVEGTREVESSLDEGRPELQVRIDRERASAVGLNAYTIASYLRTAIAGSTATTFKVDGEEFDVVVSLTKNERGIAGLRQLMIPTPLGTQVPLGELADLHVVEGPIVITREDQERVVNISAALSGRDLNSAVLEINEKIQAYPLPAGYSIEMGGEAEEMVNAFRDLVLALLLAVAFVYMIMASQFESLLQPFIIMFTVPLGFIGAVWALAIAGIHLSVPALLGLIVLAGIVVNNGIVLVDYVNTLRKRGHTAEEALMLAGPVRFRPIMMTALTTILALVPTAVSNGEGAELQAPLAVAVIGGLTVATFLTLIVVPVFYLSFEQLSRKRRNRRAQKAARRAVSTG
ncbi:MAG TPA: efflux RND transporter permease subunit [Firmicutes bacterium]|nr:efflux RND transporter permease subunit [Bacillota bacterium]